MKEEEDPRNNNQEEKRKFPRVLIPLFIFGFGSFGVLVYLLRMPKEHLHHGNNESLPKALPLTAAPANNNYNNEGNSCTSSRCIESARYLVESMDRSVNPCDDFFEYACGGWVRNNPIPSHVSKWSHFGKLDAQSNKVIRDILRQPAKSSDPYALRQAKEFYTACADVNELDRVGLNPILSFLEEYGGWPMIKQGAGSWSPDKFDWLKSMADLKRLFGTSAFFDIQINQNIAQPQYSTIHLAQPSLFLSRPYLLDHKSYSGHIKAYKELIIETANELARARGISLAQKELANSAMEVIFFESALASLTRDGVTVQYGLRNATATVTLKFLQSIFDNYTFPNSTNKLDVKKLLEYTFRTSQIKITENQLVSVGDVNFIGNVFELITNTSPKTISNYVHFRMLAWIVSGTTKRMREIVTRYQKEVFGLSGSASREYVCASSAEEKFGLALSRPYLSRTKINYKDIALVVKLVEDIRKSFLSLLDEVKWMNSTLKNNLKRKASTSIKSCVGFAPWMLPNSTSTMYEEKLKEYYKELDLGKGTSYLQKLWRVRAWQSDQRFNQLKTPFTPGCKWTTYPGQVGAFYDIRRQTINIPIGVLQLPFFYTDDNFSVVNLGAIGSIIGHEFTHGFTVNGWTERDDGSFTAVSECLVRQYNNYRVKEVSGGIVNGALTLDENFPDNGGLMEAYRAYKRFSSDNNSNGGEMIIPGLEDLTPDQQFFLGYANIWCSASRPQGLRDQILLDHHTPNRFRVMGSLQNTKEFAQAFNCPLGSNLNPRGGKRCSVF